jgi:hypothetical protein
MKTKYNTKNTKNTKATKASNSTKTQTSPKINKFIAPKYDDLFCAVSQFGGPMHKEFWGMMTDAGFTKREMTYRFTQMLLGINAVNEQILKASNFNSKP